MSLVAPIFDSNRMARRIREQRKALGLSQCETAKRCGWNQPKLSDYERGGRCPSPENLFTLCQVLQVPADYILGLTDELP